MQVEVDVKCMETSFGGCGFSGFGVMASFACLQKRPKFPFGPWAISLHDNVTSTGHRKRGRSH